MMIVLQTIGGRSAENDSITKCIDCVARTLNPTRPPKPEPGRPTLMVNFHVPGPFFSPDFSGMRLESFSRKEQLIAVEVAVPGPMPEGTADAFVRAALSRAIDLSESTLRARNIDWSVQSLRQCLTEVAGCFSIHAPTPPLPEWLLTPGPSAGGDQVVSVQIPTKSRMPTPSELSRRTRLEEAFDLALAESSAGNVDGADAGDGTMGIYVKLRRANGVDAILRLLGEFNELHDATVVVRSHHGPDDETEYSVVSPAGYSGADSAQDLFLGRQRRQS